MAHVFVTRQLPGQALTTLTADHDVEIWPEAMPPSYRDLRARAAHADGLLTLLTDRIDEALLANAPRLKVVSNYAVGVDNIDLQAAARHNVPIGHTPDVLTETTADLAWTLLMAAARRLPQATADARAGGWLTWDPNAYLGADIHGATLLIIGGGRIGEAVARRARGFDMRVIIAGRNDPLDALLPEADYVSLHCPLTAETRHLINGDRLRRMKPTAILVNTARGAIIDADALAQALIEARIAGAALDVTDPEPLPPEHPLWTVANLLIAPHIGSATRATRERMAEMAVANLLAGLAGDPLPHQLKPAA